MRVRALTVLRGSCYPESLRQRRFWERRTRCALAGGEVRAASATSPLSLPFRLLRPPRSGRCPPQGTHASHSIFRRRLASPTRSSPVRGLCDRFRSEPPVGFRHDAHSCRRRRRGYRCAAHSGANRRSGGIARTSGHIPCCRRNLRCRRLHPRDAACRSRDPRARDRPRSPLPSPSGAGLVAASEGRLTLVPGRFGTLDTLVREQGIESADAVVLDIGVSSMQIDQADRGFSFRNDGPLDMRMERAGQSAADLVNGAEEATLADIIYHYGEERRSRAVARAIIEARRKRPDRDHGGARRDRVERGLGGSRQRNPSGHPDVPGAAHRRERRIGRTRPGAPCRRANPPAGRTPRRGHVPFPGRPYRQTVLLRAQRSSGPGPPVICQAPMRRPRAASPW